MEARLSLPEPASMPMIEGRAAAGRASEVNRQAHLPPGGFTARHNPFRSERIEALRFRLDEAGWAALLDRLRALRYRGAIVGPEGSGKTTLLIELAERLRAESLAARVLLADGSSRLSLAEFGRLLAEVRSPRGVLLWDGADRLGWWGWLRLRWTARGAGGLVVTLHRPGRLPTLHQCRTSPRLLADLARELLHEASLDCRPSPQELGRLFTACRGNLREAFRVLYDRCAAGKAGAASPTVS